MAKNEVPGTTLLGGTAVAEPGAVGAAEVASVLDHFSNVLGNQLQEFSAKRCEVSS